MPNDKTVTTFSPEFITVLGKQWRRIKPVESFRTGDWFEIILNGWGYAPC
jgi:hypothetical protein